MKNVLFIMADQLRYDALGCTGNTVAVTPHLDDMAKRGVMFQRCYTPNPICVPARATVITGNYSHKATGSKNNGGRIRDDQDKMPELFARAGYRTYAMGKLHYVPYSAPGEPRLLHGFQTAELCESGRMLRLHDPEGRLRGVEDYADYLSDAGWRGFTRAHGLGNNDLHPGVSPLPAEHFVDAWVAERTIAHLTRHAEERNDQPFFMFMSFPKPHSPYDPPRPYDAMFDPRRVPAAIDRALLETRSPTVRTTAWQHGMQYLSPEAVQVMRAHYYGLVSFQDRMIGRVMQYLDRAGLRDDTIVLYTADHGDLLGDFGGCFKCNWLEGSAHVPFILSAPGQAPAGKASDELVGLQDILPTLSTLTGVPLTRPCDGKDLSGVMQGNGGVRDVFIGQCLESPSQSYMAFDGRWKYAYSETNAFEELYDLQSDPRELRNLALAGEARDQSARLRKEIISWCAANGDAKMLEGGGLKRTDVDIKPRCEFHANSLGWRWY